MVNILLPFVYALQTAFRNYVPVSRILFAFMEKVSNLIARLITIIWINLESRNTINNDLSWTTLIGCKSW
ncbi:hypothetical protein Hanom_Chr07g00640711 [Helianthus anomalus]